MSVLFETISRNVRLRMAIVLTVVLVVAVPVGASFMVSAYENSDDRMWQELRAQSPDQHELIDYLESKDVEVSEMAPATWWSVETHQCVEDAISAIQTSQPEWEAYEAIPTVYVLEVRVGLADYQMPFGHGNARAAHSIPLLNCNGYEYSSTLDTPEQLIEGYNCYFDLLREFAAGFETSLEQSAVAASERWQYWEKYWSMDSSQEMIDLTSVVRSDLEAGSGLTGWICGVRGDRDMRTAALRVAVEDRVSADSVTHGEAANEVLLEYYGTDPMASEDPDFGACYLDW